MTFINLLFILIVSFSTGMCLFLIMNKAIEIWFDIQDCKRNIERLERQIKNLPCNRQ